jgi:hypothetical protein
MIAGEPFSSEKAFPRTPSKKLPARGLFCLLKPECLHTDGRKLSQAARGHQPYPLHYVSKVGAVFALRFLVEKNCIKIQKRVDKRKKSGIIGA